MRRTSILRGVAYARRVTLAAALAAVFLALMASSATALPSNCQQSVATATCFWGPGDYTPNSFIIPAGVSLINVQVAGGRGAGAGPSQCDPYCGGRGGLVTFTVPVTSGEGLGVVVGRDGQPNSAGGAGGSYGPGGGESAGGSGCNGGGGASTVEAASDVPAPVNFEVDVGGGGGDGCAGSNAQINDPLTQGGDAGTAGSAGPNLQDGGGGQTEKLGGVGGSGGVGSENSGAPGQDRVSGGGGGAGPCGTDGCGGSGGGGGGDGGGGGGSGGEGAFNGALRVTYAGSGGGGGGGGIIISSFPSLTSWSISLADAPFATISWAIPPPHVVVKLINCPRCRRLLRITVPAPGVISERQASLISHGPRFSARHSRRKPLIKPTTVTVSAAGTIKLNLRLTTAGKRALERRDKLRVTVLITYTPTGGQPVSKTITVTFRRPQH